jgi:hypothetical protein
VSFVLFFVLFPVLLRQGAFAAHESCHLLNALQRERRIGQGLHGNGHKLHGIVISQYPVRANITAAAATVDDGPLALVANPDRNGFHDSAAVRSSVTGLDVYVKTLEAIGAVVTVITAGTCRYYQTTAVAAVKSLFTGVVLIISLFVLFSLIFTIHRGYPPSKYFVSGYIIAKFRDMSMPQCSAARYSSA